MQFIFLYHSNCQHQHQHQQQQQPQQEVAKTMQAIEYHGNRNLKYVTDRPIPEITHPHDVKIKISHCGICGSDLHEYLDGPISLMVKSMLCPKRRNWVNA